MLKKMIFSVFLFSMLSFAQKGFEGPPPRNERMEQLINARLIKSLDLDEETSVRFFARRNAHRQKMKELSEKRDSILKYLHNQLKGEKGSYFSIIQASLNVENEIVAEKNNFINSLNDILSEKQVASFVVFEVKLRREVRNLIMDKRKMQRKQKNRGKNGFFPN